LLRAFPFMLLAAVVSCSIAVFFFHLRTGKAAAGAFVPLLVGFVLVRVVILARSLLPHRPPRERRSIVERAARTAAWVFMLAAAGWIIFVASAVTYRWLGMHSAGVRADRFALILASISGSGFVAVLAIEALSLRRLRPGKTINRETFRLRFGNALLGALLPVVPAPTVLSNDNESPLPHDQPRNHTAAVAAHH
jgi:hypothetical protein